MNRMMKVVLGIITAAIVVLMALVVLVKLYVTPERIKAVVMPMIEQKLHRKVSLGDVRVGLFSGIELDELEIAGRKGDEPLLATDFVRLRFQLLPLLARRVIIDEVRLERPRVSLRRDVTGELNISDLLAVAAGGGDVTGQAPASDAGPPVSLLVSDLRVVGGEVSFVDSQPDPVHPVRIGLTGLEVTAAGFVLDGNLPLQLKGTLNGAPLAVSGTVRLKEKAGRFMINLQGLDAMQFAPYFRLKFPGRLGSLKLDLKADVDRSPKEISASGVLTGSDLSLQLVALPATPVSKARVQVDFDLTARSARNELDLRKLAIDYNGLVLSAAGSLTTLDTTPKADLVLTLPGLDLQKAMAALPPGLLGKVAALAPSGVVRGEFKLAGELTKPLASLKQGSLSLERVQGTVAGVRPSLDGRFQLADGNLRIERLAAVLGEIRADITGTVSALFDNPRADLALSVPRVELAAALAKAPPELIKGVAGLTPAGHVEATARLAGPLSAPDKLLQSASVVLSGVRVSAGGQQPAFNGRLSLKNDQLVSEGLFVELAGNRADLSVTAGNLFGTPKTVKADVTSRRFLIEPLLQGGAGAAEAAGKDSATQTRAPSGELGPYDLPLQASGTLRIGETVWKGLAVKDFVAEYTLRDNQLTVSRMTGQVAGGTFNNSARIDLRQPGLAYTADLLLQGVQADSLLTAFVPSTAGTLFGMMNLRSGLSGRGTRRETVSRTLSGDGTLILNDGRLVSPALVNGLSAFLQVPELDQINFKDFSGKFRAVDGRFEIDSALTGSRIRLFPKGILGLDGSLNLSMDTRLSPELSARMDRRGQITKYLVDADGWTQMPLLVSGTCQTPRFGLDPKGVQSQATRALQQELQKGLDELLQKQPPPPASSPGEANPSAPVSPDQSQPSQTSGKTPDAPAKGLIEDTLKQLLGR